MQKDWPERSELGTAYVISDILLFGKKALSIYKTSQFAPYFYYPANLFPPLVVEENTTIRLRSVTFYHHCVFAKDRIHLYCPIRTLFYMGFGLQQKMDITMKILLDNSLSRHYSSPKGS